MVWIKFTWFLTKEQKGVYLLTTATKSMHNGSYSFVLVLELRFLSLSPVLRAAKGVVLLVLALAFAVHVLADQAANKLKFSVLYATLWLKQEFGDKN